MDRSHGALKETLNPAMDTSMAAVSDFCCTLAPMRRPKDTVTTPNGNWNYRQPETKKVFNHPHLKVLFSQIWSHRIALPDLGMDVSGGWKDRLLHDICLQNEWILCQDTEDKGVWAAIGDVWRFLHSLGDLVLSEEKSVPQEEAERRARICLSGASGRPCPYNQVIPACLGCKGAGKAIEAVMGKKSTPYDKELHACTVCSCVLKIKIHLPLNVIHVDESQLPSFCWQRKTVETPSQPS